MGRGVDTDIRINDISVSRVHAYFLLENGKFYIQDNSSKFGTLILMNQPLELNKNINALELQCGRTILKVTVKKLSSKALSCCGYFFINYLSLFYCN